MHTMFSGVSAGTQCNQVVDVVAPVVTCVVCSVDRVLRHANDSWIKVFFYSSNQCPEAFSAMP